MENQRLILFFVLASVIWIGWVAFLAPRPEEDPNKKKDEAGQVAENDGDKKSDKIQDKAPKDKDAKGKSDDKADQTKEAGSKSKNDTKESTTIKVSSSHPRIVPVLGSVETSTLSVTFDSLGATVRGVQLTVRNENGRFVYEDLETDVPVAYLGINAVEPAAGSGVTVLAVGPDTPAQKAGVTPGDVLLTIGEKNIENQTDLETHLNSAKIGSTVLLALKRSSEQVNVEVELEARPLQLMKTTQSGDEEIASFLVALGHGQVGDFDAIERLQKANWKTEVADNVVTFSIDLTQNELAALGLESDGLRIIKRYELPEASEETPNYHILFDLQIENLGDSEQTVTFKLDGANGLPTEGWWFANKIHPTDFFTGAGARDVIYRMESTGRMIAGTRSIVQQAQDEEDPTIRLFDGSEPEYRTVQYIGIDTLYFDSILIPGDFGSSESMLFRDVRAKTVGSVDSLRGRGIRTGNVTYELTSEPITVAGKETYSQRFTVFLGPKRTEILQQYTLNDNLDLGETIIYGWALFSSVARLMAGILHFFHSIVGNYGIAIIMLTVLVRGLMYPISRKAAKNAQIMQLLAPEMKAINDKYKNDMEKRTKAMRELYAKYDHNPLSGCLLMFCQLPIFIGLYKCLNVDIELRQATLIPGLRWCSNLSGPDMFLTWNFWDYLTGKEGWLGPYLNILPIATIALFLIQQKLFTPPAMDETQRQQQAMMKYMMIFFCIMFFKVPSGLCLYFIASSIWGIAERKLLPPPEAKLPEPKDPSPTKSPPPKKRAKN